MEDLVSVIMPNYNGEKFIEKSIKSVINQTYENWELLIVDDCSKDSSLEIIKKYSSIDSRIKYFVNQKNSGAAVSRNVAIENAKGRFIAFLDSDDLWNPRKLALQIKFMLENNYFFSCSHYNVINDNDEEKAQFKPVGVEYDYKNIIRRNDIGCLTVIYDSSKIGKKYMPVEAIKREDYACWLEILKTNNCYCLHDILASYRVHESVSSNKRKMIKYQWRVFRKIEKINFFKSAYFMVLWALNGLRKYK